MKESRREAMQMVIEMAESGRHGDLTTVVCESLGIGMDTFLRYSQASDESRMKALKALASQYEMILLTLDLGHGGI